MEALYCWERGLHWALRNSKAARGYSSIWTTYRPLLYQWLIAIICLVNQGGHICSFWRAMWSCTHMADFLLHRRHWHGWSIFSLHCFRSWKLPSTQRFNSFIQWLSDVGITDRASCQYCAQFAGTADALRLLKFFLLTTSSIQLTGSCTMERRSRIIEQIASPLAIGWSLSALALKS